VFECRDADVPALLSGGAQGSDVTERVPTGCDAIDELLGGGFERGAVTQVYGPPAAGKSNIVLSAAVELAATGDRALLVDTEGLSVERLEQLARGRTTDVDDLASRIVISEAHTFEEQEEAVRDVEELIGTVEFVAVDSATGFYRLQRTEQEEGEALRAVGRQLAHLLSLARKHDVAVAFTNQVFSDPESDRTRALGGHTLNHWSATVVRVDRFRGGNRRVTLEKHRSKAAGEAAHFRISDDGLVSADKPQ
jgi:DNA repair protein RadB